MIILAAVILIFIGGCLSGGVITVLLLRNSRRARAVLAGISRERSASASAARIRLAAGPDLVAAGGGTGLSSLLRGLKSYTRNITAFVTVTDEGGSSGRLVRDWGMLPPGDIRNCLVALSENDDRLGSFMNFRFEQGDVRGHSLGNLILLAATELSGDFKSAVEMVNDLLAIRGRVLPITSENAVLVGITESGKTLRGELAIASRREKLKDIRLDPPGVRAVDEIHRALHHCDMVILGPGSLFTSVLPNLLVGEFAETVRTCGRPVIYVANLMTQPGETGDMTQIEHIAWVARALGRFPDVVVVSDAEIPPEILARYREHGSVPLHLSAEEEAFLAIKGCHVYRAPLLHIRNGRSVRHDSARLAEILMRIRRKYKGGEIYEDR